VPRRLRPAPVPPADDLEAGFDAIRRELDVPAAFPAQVEAAASAAAAGQPADPTLGARTREDLREVGFVTLDPPGSRDLDQAFALERRSGGGWRVRYAIADVAAFVTTGDAVDTEAWARGTTLYAPDSRVPLHPLALSEGAASLLPGEERPACVWTIDLDADGEQVAVDLRRAWVRSRAQLDYPAAQRDLDAGTADEPLVLLAEVDRPARGPSAGAAASICPSPSRR
jgi:exoribonuclease R